MRYKIHPADVCEALAWIVIVAVIAAMAYVAFGGGA